MGGGTWDDEVAMNINLQLKMITYSSLMVLLFVSLSYLNHNPADATSVNVSMHQTSSMRLVRMNLQGLQENKIESAEQVLQQLPGIQKINVDPSQQSVTLLVDMERTNLKTIERSLHTAGFTPIYR
jgi:hypothetical protein